ncbi:hypothetical protein ACFQ2B_15110 [Streptomyces stramineus]
MGDVFLRRLSRWQAEQYRDQLADLHVAAYENPLARSPSTAPGSWNGWPRTPGGPASTS